MHLTEGRCRDLIHGLLPSVERDAALEHVEHCAVCEAMFLERAGETERLRVIGARHGIGLHEESTTAPEAVAVRGGWRRFVEALRTGRGRASFGLATAAAAAAVALFLLPRGSGDPLTDLVHQLPDYTAVTHRASGQTLDPALVDGLVAYTDQDVDRAIALLREARATGPMETIRRLYLGSALTLTGDHEEASTLLGALSPQRMPDPWRTEARWTFYVALEGAGRRASADSLLSVLEGEAGELGERAREHRREREAR